MPYRPAKILAAATLTAIVLLAPSAGLVAITTDRPLGTGMFILATVLCDLTLCVFLGNTCLWLGLLSIFISGERPRPRLLVGYGAALALIVFTVARLLHAFVSAGPSSGGPPGGTNGS